ncbi:hypothetical protein ACLGIH_02430 [Streptomyces sp. HMX87]|uniref:hypothetical protein n=1 Tax=Streptomyces sp. HMX87 TaxID=3390849 RepID=UPI003A87B741
MATHIANGDTRDSFWPRVREYAVPPSMIETATARRRAGDWAGACAAAGIDVDLDLRGVARAHGRDLAARVRADLRRLAPDLLRWHMPRIAPDGLLRPGLTVALARYGTGPRKRGGPPFLVVRTAPAWADAGQRMSLALWGGSRSTGGAFRHPHPRPSRRFRLDLHRHLWDATRAHELRTRSGAAGRPPAGGSAAGPGLPGALPPGHRCAVDRWAAEAGIVLRAEGRSAGPVVVRLGSRHRLLLHLDLLAGGGGDGDGETPPALRITAAGDGGSGSGAPVLPDAATWTLPDLELLRAGSIEPDRLHPLVASALVPGHRPAARSAPADRAGEARLVECRGARHRIGLVDGVLTALDHDPAEVRREELLAALTGTPLPCLQAIDRAHRRPDCLAGVRERLDHGDHAGALAVVEELLDPDAVLRGGALRDELEAAAQRRIVHGLYRAGLAEPGPARVRPADRSRPRDHRPRPRHATLR